MIAIIETGGKQYLVKEGNKVSVDVLPGKPQDKVMIDRVLLLAQDDGSDVKLGMPYLEDKKVEAVILEHKKDKKVRVFKFKTKIRYRRRQGHRQQKTVIEIKKI